MKLIKVNTKASSVNGDMTIEEFVRKFCGDKLDKVIKLK